MSDEGFDENTLGYGEGDVGEREEEEENERLSSNKRIKEKPIDRLSALPDAVLVRILSFLLYTSQAGKTSVLSKRWRFLWAELPKLEFSRNYKSFTVEVMSNIKEILEEFMHVKKLQVKRQCFEALSMLAVNGWQLPQSSVQHLTLVSSSEYKHGISGIIGLLESSPNLETLVLEGYDTEGEIVNLDPTVKDDLDGDLLHLKTVEVNNFADSNGEPLLSLVRILLRRAPALDEMVITIDVEDTRDYVNIAQKLLTYPRSSTKAEIHLTYCRYG